MAPAVELLILMELQVGEEEVVSVVAEEEVVAELPQQVETTELPQAEVLVEDVEVVPALLVVPTVLPVVELVEEQTLPVETMEPHQVMVDLVEAVVVDLVEAVVVELAQLVAHMVLQVVEVEEVSVVVLALQVDLMVLQVEEMEEAVVVAPALPVETMELLQAAVVLVEAVVVELALLVAHMELQVAEQVEALELETVTELLVTTWLDTTAEEEEEDVEVVNPEEESLPPLTGNKSATSLDGLLLLTEFRFNEIMEVCPNEGIVI